MGFFVPLSLLFLPIGACCIPLVCFGLAVGRLVHINISFLCAFAYQKNKNKNFIHSFFFFFFFHCDCLGVVTYDHVVIVKGYLSSLLFPLLLFSLIFHPLVLLPSLCVFVLFSLWWA